MIERWTPAGRRLLGLLPCAVLLVALVSSGTPLLARLLIVALFGVTLWNPAAGLLAAAGLAPLGLYIAALDGITNFRITEAILLSFIAAWLLRTPSTRFARSGQAPSAESALEGPRLPGYARLAAWLFSILIISLAVALSTQLLRYPGVLRTNLSNVARFYFSYGDPTGISDCARTFEGFALVGAAMEIFRRRPSLANSLPTVLALSGMAAALASVLLWFGIAPHAVLVRKALFGDVRMAAHVGDLNAAGTHFVLILCLTLGMSMRDRGRRRVFWLATAVACALGLWLCRSRSAEAAAGLVIPAAALWALTTAWPRQRRAWLIGSVLAALLALGAFELRQIQRDPFYHVAGFRQGFVMSSVRAMGRHAVFGIGVGRYFRDSPNFLTPRLAWEYGSENAHNNFLQIAVETGLIGFFLYAAWFAGALRQGFSALTRGENLSRRSGVAAKADWRLLGATAGIVAVLGTCLVGHPLLVPEVAAACFLQLALVASLGGASGPPDRLRQGYGESRRSEAKAEGGHYETNTPVAFWPAAAVIGTMVLGVLPAWTLRKPMMPVHLEEVEGLYYRDEIADGMPFRWTREYASLFVPDTWRTVSLSLRAKKPTRVEITSGGLPLLQTMVDDKWSSVTLNLPSPEPPLLFSRINLKVDPTSQVSSDDPRVVGVQVGNISLLRIAWEFVPRPDSAPTSR